MKDYHHENFQAFLSPSRSQLQFYDSLHQDRSGQLSQRSPGTTYYDGRRYLQGCQNTGGEMMEDLIEIMWKGNIGLGVWTGEISGEGYVNVYYIFTNEYWHEIPAETEEEAIAYFNKECEKNK